MIAAGGVRVTACNTNMYRDSMARFRPDIQEGQITRNARARVIRNNESLHDSKISSLKRFTEDVREVATGFECGIGIDGFNDFEEGDIIEAYVKERVN